MIQIGNDKIKDIYVGSDKIKEVYYGSEKVWGEIESIQEGYWVHKDTGVKTSFGLEDPSIVDGIMSGPSWRYDCSEVQIPSGVTGLGVDCFMDCTSLTSITLPEGLTSIGLFALMFCDSLTSITLPRGVTNIGDGAFRSCTSLTSITLPEGLTSIEYGTFENCTSLTSITLPEGVTSIGKGAFMDCLSLSLVTSLPTVPPSLGSYAFSSTHANLIIKVPAQSVNAYKTATNWINYAHLISAIPVPGYWVHKDTGVKTYFDLEDSSIVDGIMSKPSWRYDCSEVNIPEGVTQLGVDCFFHSTSLTSITLPEGVTSIGMGAFEECSSLSLVTLLPTIPPSLGMMAFASTYPNFKVPAQSVDAYKTATNWIMYATQISAI